jgi:3-hydroxyacyl-CoA dehydrogenase/enoyl-CoA hydratase/3-hydroxybutyryl-CoA epimerase
VRFAQQIGKLPVVVKDSPGFLVNRILMPYLLEAANLFEGGARVADIDEAMLDFGMPMGPLRLLDEVGLDVSLHVAETLAGSFPGRMRVPDCLREMIEKGSLGRKTGRGFYLHAKSGDAAPDPGVCEFAHLENACGLPREELQERMMFLMSNEAARCLEEGVAADAADVDFAMVMGTGYAPFRGGPLREADAIGAARLAGAMEHLVANGAARFAPCALLAELAASGRRFYVA